jgi:hypothetical protein
MTFCPRRAGGDPLMHISVRKPGRWGPARRSTTPQQMGMAERNAKTPEDKRITFRMGINLGDVNRLSA